MDRGGSGGCSQGTESRRERDPLWLEMGGRTGMGQDRRQGTGRETGREMGQNVGQDTRSDMGQNTGQDTGRDARQEMGKDTG